jgi:phosphoribosylanthranilate isomerase
MYIKICGVTNSEDADYAIECGATHIGLIFVEQSKRCVSAAEGKQITADIAKRAVVVGVFQNNDLAFVQEVSQFTKLNIVQLHGNEEPSYCSQVSGPVMKALAIASLPAHTLNSTSGKEDGLGQAKDEAVGQDAEQTGQDADRAVGQDADQPLIDLIKQYRKSADYLLFDRPKAQQEPDWLEHTLGRLARIQDQLPPYFFAGGLNPGNLKSVFRSIRPYGVDVASGVEESPRKKDFALIAEFCASARAESGGWVDHVLLDEAASYLPVMSPEEEKKAMQQLLSRTPSKEEAR